MTIGFTRWRFFVVMLGSLAAGISVVVAQTNFTPKLSGVALQEHDACINNLKVIFDAVQAYKTDNKRLPNWLSDLVPQYLSDANVLICPNCLRTGHLESSGVADPKLPCSYLYEFSPAPLGDLAPTAPDRTRRDWRERQMSLLGPVVPIVRCRHHKQVLNLAYDGKIYESAIGWEALFTNQVGVAALSAARMFDDGSSDSNGSKTVPNSAAPGIMASLTPAQKSTVARQARPRPGLINLAKYCNATLTNSWLGGAAGDLASLPEGRQIFGGVEFDVRGIIQLGGKSLAATEYPALVKSIRIHRKCQTLHFLHAAAFGSAQDEGMKVGAYVVHYSTNAMRLELPITYGQEVRDWHSATNETPSGELKVAWTGVTQSASGDASSRPIRLFMTSWTNVAPTVEIERIDFSSTLTGPAPFLVAITSD
jgi:hypothetical protein